MHWGWIIRITIAAFFISVVLTFLSSGLISRINIVAAFFVLFLFILLGILFDIIGVAVASSDERPFHSMAAKKVKGAKQAIVLIRNSQKVSSFCNDVVGDIAGIISGVTVAVIISFFASSIQIQNTALLSICITGAVAALTIGGKAIGKTIAMNHANTIVYAVARFIHFISNREKK